MVGKGLVPSPIFVVTRISVFVKGKIYGADSGLDVQGTYHSTWRLPCSGIVYFEDGIYFLLNTMKNGIQIWVVMACLVRFLSNFLWCRMCYRHHSYEPSQDGLSLEIAHMDDSIRVE